MIATGHLTVGTTEVVDVVSGKTCDDLPDFPLNVGGAVGANLDGTPVVCGGGGVGISKACFKFTNSEWTEFATLNEARYWAAGIVYKKKFHIFGGYSGGVGNTSEIISLNGVVERGPDLPVNIEFHAITAINATTSILSGGKKKDENIFPITWYYNHETQIFTNGPILQEEKQQHGSATGVDKVTQAKIPIVTGGRQGNGFVAATSTELLINGKWQSQGTISLQKRNTLLICSSAIF